MTSLESFKHLRAKEQLAEFLYEDFLGQNYRILLEYPIIIDSHINSTICSFDESHSEYFTDKEKYKICKGYDILKKNNLIPIVIVDIMVIRKGMPEMVYEVVHKNKCDTTKLNKFKKYFANTTINTVEEVNADWILNQVKNPRSIKSKIVYEIVEDSSDSYSISEDDCMVCGNSGRSYISDGVYGPCDVCDRGYGSYEEED